MDQPRKQNEFAAAALKTNVRHEFRNVGTKMNDLTLSDLRSAELLASSSLLPDHLKGRWARRPGRVDGRYDAGEFELFPQDVRTANVLLVLNAARQFDVNPLSLINSSYIANGKLEFDGKIYAALANRMLSKRLNVRYEGAGDQRKAIVFGRIRGELQDRSVTVALRDARSLDRAGNTTRQWTKHPEQMLFYFLARTWVRRHLNDAIFGISAADDRPYEAYESIAESSDDSDPGSDATCSGYLLAITSAASMDELREIRTAVDEQAAAGRLNQTEVEAIRAAGSRAVQIIQKDESERAQLVERYLQGLNEATTKEKRDQIVVLADEDLQLSESDAAKIKSHADSLAGEPNNATEVSK
jgi:hypothetical protein